MTKRISEKETVIKQIRSIVNNYYKDKIINFCNILTEHNNKIGYSKFINSNEYENVFQKIVDNNEFFLMLKDQSLISIAYIFDVSGTIVKHTLSYLPSSNKRPYIRIDYSFETPLKNHPATHLHISLEEDSCRIPVKSVLMPNDFIFFILKFFYFDESDFIENLDVGSRRNTIVKNLATKIFLSL